MKYKYIYFLINSSHFIDDLSKNKMPSKNKKTITTIGSDKNLIKKITPDEEKEFVKYMATPNTN